MSQDKSFSWERCARNLESKLEQAQATIATQDKKIAGYSRQTEQYLKVAQQSAEKVKWLEGILASYGLPHPRVMNEKGRKVQEFMDTLWPELKPSDPKATEVE